MKKLQIKQVVGLEEVCSKVDSMIFIGLNKELIPLAAAADGTLENREIITIQASLFHGSTALSDGVNFSIRPIISNININAASGLITILPEYTQDEDSAEINIEATYNSVIYSTIFSIVKIKKAQQRVFYFNSKEEMEENWNKLPIGAVITYVNGEDDGGGEEPPEIILKEYETLFEQTFTPLNRNVMNPWRGFYTDDERSYDSRSDELQIDDWFAYSKTIEKPAVGTLTLLQVGLATDSRKNVNYTPLTTAIPANKIEELRTALNSARTSGSGIIIRFEQDVWGASLNNGDTDFATNNVNAANYRSEPNDYALIQTHAEQVGDLIAEFEDIILQIQLGFYGPWGEFHSSRYSTNTGENDTQLWAEVAAGPQRYLFDAIYNKVQNKDIFIGMRRPQYIRNVTDSNVTDKTQTNNTWGYNSTGLGVNTKDVALTEEEAFTNSKKAKASFFHDSLFGGDGDSLLDSETWADPRSTGTDIQKKAWELDYLNKHSLYTPSTGESYTHDAPNNPYGISTVAFQDAHKMHITTMNYGLDEPGGAYSQWRNSTNFSQNYPLLSNDYEYAEMMQGYRFVLSNFKIGVNTENFGMVSLKVNFSVRNDGWGNLLKKSDLCLVFKYKNASNTDRWVAKTNIDPRKWNASTSGNGLPGGQTYNYELYFKPSWQMASWDFDVCLQIRSPFEDNVGNSWYSILFSNENMWSNDNLSNYRSYVNKVGEINLGEYYELMAESNNNGEFVQIDKNGNALFDSGSGAGLEQDYEELPSLEEGLLPLNSIAPETNIGNRKLKFDTGFINEFNALPAGSAAWLSMNPYNNDASEYGLTISSSADEENVGTNYLEAAIVKDGTEFSMIHDFKVDNFNDFVLPPNTVLTDSFSLDGGFPSSLINKILITESNDFEYEDPEAGIPIGFERLNTLPWGSDIGGKTIKFGQNFKTEFDALPSGIDGGIEFNIYNGTSGTYIFAFDTDATERFFSFVEVVGAGTANEEWNVLYDFYANNFNDFVIPYNTTINATWNVWTGVFPADLANKIYISETEHNHNYDGYTFDENGHWQVCTLCGEKINIGQHNGDPCTICGYTAGQTSSSVPLVSLANDTDISGKTLSFDPTIADDINSLASGIMHIIYFNPYNGAANSETGIMIHNMTGESISRCCLMNDNWDMISDFAGNGYQPFVLPAGTTYASNEAWEEAVPNNILNKILISI